MNVCKNCEREDCPVLTGGRYMANQLRCERVAHDRTRYELAALKSEIDLHASDWSPNERTLAAVMRAARSARFVAEQRAGEARRAITRVDSPWPLVDILRSLVEASEHLMRDHNCDAHGYEQVISALEAAHAILRALLPGPAATGETGGGA